MKQSDTLPNIRWDEKAGILAVYFVGQITSDNIPGHIKHIEAFIATIPSKPIKTLHNFVHVTHISLDAQIALSEFTQSPTFQKQAFISTESVIKETIDIIISIAKQDEELVKIFEDEKEAISWLLQ